MDGVTSGKEAHTDPVESLRGQGPLRAHRIWSQTLHLGHLKSQAAVSGSSPEAKADAAAEFARPGNLGARRLLITPSSRMGRRGLDP